MNPLPPIDALREFDEEAWTQLITILFPMALATAKSYLKGDFAEDARDIAMTALKVLLKKVHTVSSSEELPALLVTITFGKAMDFLRNQRTLKRGRDQVIRCGVLGDWFEAEGVPDLESLELSVDTTDVSRLAEIIERISTVLSPKVRELVIDRYRHNKSYAEIAETRGMTEGAVRVAVLRALENLRKQLQRDAPLYREARSLLGLPAVLLSLLFAL